MMAGVLGQVPWEQNSELGIRVQKAYLEQGCSRGLQPRESGHQGMAELGVDCGVAMTGTRLMPRS